MAYAQTHQGPKSELSDRAQDRGSSNIEDDTVSEETQLWREDTHQMPTQDNPSFGSAFAQEGLAAE